MKPYKTLIFLFIVFIVLSLLSLFFPKNGLQLSQDINLRFAKLEDVFNFQKSTQKDISEILAYHQSEVTSDIADLLSDTSSKQDSVTLLAEDSIVTEHERDSMPTGDSTKVQERLIKPGSVRQELEYPDNKKEK
jgi:hypothetical protein